MKKVVILSDTHAFWSEQFNAFLYDADEIWHAGDIGAMKVVDAIMMANPKAVFRAVYGNIDGPALRHTFPEQLLFEVEGLRVFIRHIIGRPEKYTQTFKRFLSEHKVDLVVCGHSHLLLVAPLPFLHPRALHINPGAMGMEGFHKQKTLIHLEVNQGQILNLGAVDFGKR